MKIVATADLHGTLPDDLPSGDVLVIAGDVCPNWDHSDPFQRSWLETNFATWLERIGPRYDAIIGIGGNHDYALERYIGLAGSLPWVYLIDSAYDVDGIRFWGSPWVPNLSRWAFHLDDARLDAKADAIDPDTNIIISHGPPFKHCDRTVPKFGDVHAGWPGWNPVLKKRAKSVALLICGHIHEGYGYDVHETGTVIANVSLNTENYKPINPPGEFSVVKSIFETDDWDAYCPNWKLPLTKHSNLEATYG